MAIKFKEVKEIDPWDKFADEGLETEGRGEIPKETLAKVARFYHYWLEHQNPKIGACILCERRFKPRTETKEKKDN